jgi:hypothetical protein
VSKAKPKRGRGRPTKYREEYAEQARKLCFIMGATDAELAEFFDVTEQTVNTWKQKHPEFLESLRAGKAVADANVAERLYQRAIGYSHDAVKIMSYEGSSWEHGYVKHYPPDVTAAQYWLKNRQPATWRDKQEVEHSGEIGGVLVVPGESDPDDWSAFAKRQQATLGASKADGNGANGAGGNGNGKRP